MLIGSEEYRNKSVRSFRLYFPNSFEKQISSITKVYLYLEQSILEGRELPYIIGSLEQIAELTSTEIELPVFHGIHKHNKRTYPYSYINTGKLFLDHLRKPSFITILGCGNYFEIWNSEFYKKQEEYVLNNPHIFEGLDLHL